MESQLGELVILKHYIHKAQRAKRMSREDLEDGLLGGLFVIVKQYSSALRDGATPMITQVFMRCNASRGNVAPLCGVELDC